MPTVLIHRTTGEIGEMQSNPSPGTLLKNIADNGGNPDEYREQEVSERVYQQMLKNDPTRVVQREISTDENDIKRKAKQLADEDFRKKAITALKQEQPGRTFKHHDNNGKRK